MPLKTYRSVTAICTAHTHSDMHSHITESYTELLREREGERHGGGKRWPPYFSSCSARWPGSCACQRSQNPPLPLWAPAWSPASCLRPSPPTTTSPWAPLCSRRPTVPPSSPDGLRAETDTTVRKLDYSSLWRLSSTYWLAQPLHSATAWTPLPIYPQAATVTQTARTSTCNFAFHVNKGTYPKACHNGIF